MSDGATPFFRANGRRWPRAAGSEEGRSGAEAPSAGHPNSALIHLPAPSPTLAGEGSYIAPIRAFTFAGGINDDTRSIAIERPVQVSYGDVPFGVMMLTPRDLEDFGTGFSLTEGVIDGVGDIRALTLTDSEDGLRLRIDLVGAKLHAHLARRRTMSGRTSCGLCGIEDLSALARAGRAQGAAPHVALGAVERALHALDRRQPLNAETHAVHGAAFCDAAGAIQGVREDVGRHNALDKLIGAMLRAAIAPEDGFVLITSRASFEMVEKVAAFGARTLVAISAPTSLALDRARDLDITLVGIARHDAITVFHGIDRIDAKRTPR